MAMTYNYFKLLVGARRGYFPALMSSIRVEVLADLARHIVRADVDVAHDQRERIAVGLGAGKSQLFRSPMADELVAACGGFEPELLVVSELLLKAFLALVERGHRDRLDVSVLAVKLRGALAPCISRLGRQGNRPAAETSSLRQRPRGSMSIVLRFAFS
jgi:hypothetical protein